MVAIKRTKEIVVLGIVNFTIAFIIYGGWLVLVKQFDLSVVMVMSIFSSAIMTFFLSKYQVVKRNGG